MANFEGSSNSKNLNLYLVTSTKESISKLKVLESQLSLSLSSIEATIRKLGSEQEVLEREIGRLSNMHQQQLYLHKQPPPCPSSIQRCNNSRDLDSHFANLSSDGGQSK